jgi:hypothetical protein
MGCNEKGNDGKLDGGIHIHPESIGAKAHNGAP